MNKQYITNVKKEGSIFIYDKDMIKKFEDLSDCACEKPEIEHISITKKCKCGEYSNLIVKPIYKNKKKTEKIKNEPFTEEDWSLPTDDVSVLARELDNKL